VVLFHQAAANLLISEELRLAKAERRLSLNEIEDEDHRQDAQVM
jgi:hypothetical protein